MPWSFGPGLLGDQCPFKFDHGHVDDPVGSLQLGIGCVWLTRSLKRVTGLDHLSGADDAGGALDAVGHFTHIVTTAFTHEGGEQLSIFPVALQELGKQALDHLGAFARQAVDAAQVEGGC